MAIPQRICFVVTSPFTIRVFMLRHLEALAARYDVTIIFNPAESPGIPLHFDSRIHLVELDINRRISLWNDLGGFISLLRIFRRERFFVVHTITPKAGLLGQIAAWMGRVPFRVHTFTGQVWVTRQGIFRFILKMVDKLYAACATHVLVDSPSQRDFLVEQGILPDGRGLVLGGGSISGVDVERFTPDALSRQKIRGQLGIPEDAVLFLYVGRLKRDKGLLDIAEAFSQHAQHHPDSWWLIVGPDEEMLAPAIMDCCARVSDRLRILGYTDTPECYMAAADVLCLPSYREGFGSVILEAAACGIPSIASRIFGITDVIVGGETGLLHKVGDVQEITQLLDELADDRLLRERMGSSARLRVVRDFSAEAVTNALLSFYEKFSIPAGIVRPSKYLQQYPERRRPGNETRMVTAVIVNYNSGDLLAVCVASLLASTERVRVVVSDNGSSDDSLVRLSALCGDDERLIIVRNGANLGFSLGCNIGLSHAVGDYVLFINPDCVVPVAAIGQMRALMDAHPEAGMAGCMVRNPDGSEQAGCRRYVPTPQRSMARVLRLNRLFPGKQIFETFNMKGTPLPARAESIEAISGAFMFVRHSVLDRVGSFDERYFLHCEDLDLCIRFTRAGHTILFDPNIEITHLKGGSRALPFFVEWHKHKGMVRFYRLHFRDRYPWLLMLLVVLAVALRFVLMTPWLLFQRGRVDILDPRIIGNRYGGLWRNNESPTARRTVIVSGATSEIGHFLLPRLVESGYRVIALSRNVAPDWKNEVSDEIFWLRADISDTSSLAVLPSASFLIHLAPLIILPEQIAAFSAIGVKRVIAISSSSKLSKAESPVAAERAYATRLAFAERSLGEYCAESDMAWTVFRPTMIYGRGMDRNITLIRRWIKVMRVCPLLGDGSGLRCPVHAEDLAAACMAVLKNPHTFNKFYELSGGEILTYRTMVKRIFDSVHMKPRFIRISPTFFKTALQLIALLPRYGDFNIAMALRMNENLNYSHDAAREDFGYRPRNFSP